MKFCNWFTVTDRKDTDVPLRGSTYSRVCDELGFGCGWAKLSLRIWDPKKTGITNVKIATTKVRDGAQALINECGGKGGSMPAPDQPDVVVHLDNEWV